MRILLVEDDIQLGESLEAALKLEQYAVDWLRSGEPVRSTLSATPYDLLILDLGLPGVPGMQVLRQLRGDKQLLPVLLLTARNTLADKVDGLEAGADDYITKPFSPKELIARIKAVLRRRAPQLTDDVISIGNLQLDPSTHRLSSQGMALTIGPTKFRLLHFFMTHTERVFTRSQLLDQVWGDHVFVEERTVDVHIRRLRKALEPSGHDKHIETIRGSGYRFALSPLEKAPTA